MITMDEKKLYDDVDETEGVPMPAMRECLDAESIRTPETMPELPSGEMGCARLERETGRKAEEGWIYFIETDDAAFIKIGFSKDPVKRMSQLGTQQPGNFRLRLIGCIPGDYRLESWLHGIFGEHRNNGEWFNNSETIRRFIETVRPTKETPRPVCETTRRKVDRIVSPEDRAAAVALAKLRNKRLSAEERQEIARKAGKASKAALTPEQRSELARKAGLAGGRGRKKDHE